MPELDPLLLSRLQFAFTISFHILFPSFTIGLAAWLLLFEFMWSRLRRQPPLLPVLEKEAPDSLLPDFESKVKGPDRVTDP